MKKIIITIIAMILVGTAGIIGWRELKSHNENEFQEQVTVRQDGTRRGASVVVLDGNGNVLNLSSDELHALQDSYKSGDISRDDYDAAIRAARKYVKLH